MAELNVDGGEQREAGNVDSLSRLNNLPGSPEQNVETGRDFAQGRRGFAQGGQQFENQQSYYVRRDGTIYKDGDDGAAGQRIQFHVESADGTYELVAGLTRNNQGLVQFPATGVGFERYGAVDTGGRDRITGEEVGRGDHFLRPEVAAGLFGLSRVLNDNYRINMSFGDMSSSNGSDPWQWEERPRSNNGHHAGHGHFGNRSGEDIDFRYVDQNGIAFQAPQATTDERFSSENNQTIYDTARMFGFTQNYQGRGSNLQDVRQVGGHNDHGHLGFVWNDAVIIEGRPPAVERGRYR